MSDPRQIFPVTFFGRDREGSVPPAVAEAPDPNKVAVPRQATDIAHKDFRAIRRDEKAPVPAGTVSEGDPKVSSVTDSASHLPSASPDSLVDLEALRAFAEKENQQKTLSPDEVDSAPHRETGEIVPPVGESPQSVEETLISSSLLP